MLSAIAYASFLRVAGLAQDCPMHAQHTRPAPVAPQAPSPYAGEEARTIKALSEADTKAYLDGTGMGMAKPAELNQYPGPRHVLDHAQALELSELQRAAIGAAYERMHAAAVPLGEQIVDAEGRLDALFARGEAEAGAIEDLTGEIGTLQGRLRAVHLKAHVEVRAVLSPAQIAEYGRLRGYAHAGH